MIESRQFPIQNTRERGQQTVPEAVYMAAYEVYCHVLAPQEALIDLDGRNCRGGFSVGELVAYLYARPFPKEEWQQRFHDACEGMKL